MPLDYSAPPALPAAPPANDNAPAFAPTTAPANDVTAPSARSLDEQFADFHAANPHVYETLARLARHAAARGRTRIGAKALWERMRWELTVETDAPDFRLNNNFVSRYARLLMANEPGLAGLFETRELRS